MGDRTAYSMEAVQTPASRTGKLMDHYVSIVENNINRIMGYTRYIAADAYFMKKTFIGPMLTIGLQVITRMRPDANLQYVYTGPQKKGRGRKRITDINNQGEAGIFTNPNGGLEPTLSMGAEGDAAKTGVKYSDDLVKAAQQLYPPKAVLTELHHIAPRYLGGATNGALVPLNGAYHQVITNEFRSIYPYGLPNPGEARMLEIMEQVYSKYPLPPGY